VTDERRAPRFDKAGVPWCTEERCPSHDGKRCREIGFKPSRICEPEVKAMAEELVRLRRARHSGVGDQQPETD
jgi:hypothetical protein